MNIFAGSGRLVRNAVVNGTETKAMRFTIAAGCGYDTRAKKERVEFVPCVLFNPPEELMLLLSQEGKGQSGSRVGEGREVERRGRSGGTSKRLRRYCHGSPGKAGGGRGAAGLNGTAELGPGAFVERAEEFVECHGAGEERLCEKVASGTFGFRNV